MTFQGDNEVGGRSGFPMERGARVPPDCGCRRMADFVAEASTYQET